MEASTPSHAVSDTRYRYIRYANGFDELYDLHDDPHEFTNRAADPAQLVDIVEMQLSGEMPDVPDAEPEVFDPSN